SEPAGGGCAPLRRDRRGHEGHDVPRACQEPINTFALTASILPEPHDRLERSSPGYRPGASPSTLAGQSTAATPPGDRRLADVRHAVSGRVCHPPPTRTIRCYRVTRPVHEPSDGGARSRLELQGSESNRPGSRLMRPGRAQPSLHDPDRLASQSPTTDSNGPPPDTGRVRRR